MTRLVTCAQCHQNIRLTTRHHTPPAVTFDDGSPESYAQVVTFTLCPPCWDTMVRTLRGDSHPDP